MINEEKNNELQTQSMQLFRPIRKIGEPNQRLFHPIEKKEVNEQKLIPLFKKIEVKPKDEEKTMQQVLDSCANNEKQEQEVSNEKCLNEIVQTKKALKAEQEKQNVIGVEPVEAYGNFSIDLLQRIREVDKKMEGDRIKSYYIFSITLTNGEKYFAKVAGKELYNLLWISEFSGGAAYIETSPNARQNIIKHIHQMIDCNGYKTCTHFLQNGWKKIDGKWKYVIDTGIVGVKQDVILGDQSHPFIYYPQYIGDKQIFENAIGMLQICNDLSVSLPLFLFTHIGALCKLFELANIPVKGVLAVVGMTNSRKTSMTLCMTKIFCRDDIFNPEISFESTQGGIEVESSKHADSVLLVDDFHPAISKRNQNKMLELLEFILRRYGDRTVKKRMMDFMANKSNASYGVEGVCVITGEDIAGVQSSMTRVLVLEVDRDCVDNDKLSFYQENYGILTTHLYDFLDFVTNNFNTIITKLKLSVLNYRRQAQYEIPRYNEYSAQFLATAQIIAEYAMDRKFWDQGYAQAWIKICEKEIDLVIRKNIVNVNREDFASMIMQALNNTLEEYGVIGLEELKPRRLAHNEIASDSNYFYLTVDYLMEITKKYWSRLGKELPFSSKKQLTLFLEQKELIVVKKEGDDVRRTLPIPQGKQRVLYIRRSKMSELLEHIGV